MHFKGVFVPQKAFASGAMPRQLAPTQKVHLCSQLSASVFGLVTPISGHAYVRISKNKQ